MATILLFLACAVPEPGFGGTGRDVSPTVTQADGRNAYTMAWETLDAGTATVRYGDDGSFDHVAVGTSSADGLSHEVQLVGLAGGVEWEVMVDDGEHTSQPVTLTPEPPPTDLPELAVTVPATDAVTGFSLSVVFNHPEAAVVLVDREGRYVWWQQVADTNVFRALYDPDTRSVLWLERRDGGSSGLWRCALDGQPELLTIVPTAHHDITPAPDGGWYVLGYDERDLEDWGTVIGDQVFHVSADGADVQAVWTSWDEFTYTGNAVSTGNGPEYPHTNSIVVDPATGDLILSIYIEDMLAAVDPATGRIAWRLGGDNSDWDLDQGFARQHSPFLAASGDQLTLFDNGDGSDPAEAAVYDLDWDTLTATRSFAWDQGGVHQLVAMGSAVPVDDSGSLLVAWGTDAELTRVSATGDVEWEAGWAGDSVGYTSHVSELAGAAW